MVNNTPKTKPIVEMQPILKPCFKIKRGHWKTCRAKNAPYLGRTSPYPPFHWVPPPPRGKNPTHNFCKSVGSNDSFTLSWTVMMTVNIFKFKCLNIMTVKRETSLNVMNCQFEFTVTQCSVAYGEEEEKTKQNKTKPKKITVLWCLSCFADYLLRFM